MICVLVRKSFSLGVVIGASAGGCKRSSLFLRRTSMMAFSMMSSGYPLLWKWPASRIALLSKSSR